MTCFHEDAIDFRTERATVEIGRCPRCGADTEWRFEASPQPDRHAALVAHVCLECGLTGTCECGACGGAIGTETDARHAALVAAARDTLDREEALQALCAALRVGGRTPEKALDTLDRTADAPHALRAALDGEPR